MSTAADQPIRVVVSGASGRMGREAVGAVLGQPDLRLVGALDVGEAGRDAAELAGLPPCGVCVTSTPAETLRGAHVLVDFTRADACPSIVRAAISEGVACVVGTTGLSAETIADIDATARSRGVPVLLAPNFALGAVLMMRFAQEAARYYPWAEIIELHHEKKIDAPSGTALRTAELVAAVRASEGVAGEVEKVAGARGADHQGVRVHSVRLPGLVAHQEVIFGATGETLTLRHDSLTRASFMPGVVLAVRRIGRAPVGVSVGLETMFD